MGEFQYVDSRNISRLISDRADPHAILAEEIGPAYLDYRRRWDEARAFKVQPPFPLHVDYEMKFRCNVRCPMCFMSLAAAERARYGRADLELAPAVVKNLITQGAAEGQAALGFGGLWEPLLSPALPEVVAHARTAGLVDVMFNSNGLLLNESVGRALVEAGLTRLMISLDAATEATYRLMRPGSDFGLVKNNIRNFLALKKRMGRRLPIVRLSFCLTALNEAELPAFLAEWRDEVDFFSIQTYGRYPTANPPDFPRNALFESPAPGRCAQPHKRLLVRHNGDALPCCDVSGLPLVLGNVHTQSLADIWRGPLLSRLREEQAAGALPPACRDCQSKF